MKLHRVLERRIHGGGAREVLREFEEQITDSFEVKRFLLRDLTRLGLRIEARQLVQEGNRISLREQSQNSLSRSELQKVLEIYSRTYPDHEFFLLSGAS